MATDKRSALFRLALGVLSVLAVAVAFQNCGPGFKVQEQTSSSSGSSETPTGKYLDSGLSIMNGILRPTAVGTAAGLAVEGRMMIVRDPQRGTQVYLHALGFPTTATYMSHVHDQGCSIGGGGHYKIDSSITDARQSNEFWPTLTVSPVDGAISGFVDVAHIARPEAQSVVVHAADNSRLACGLFYPQYGVTQMGGLFATLPGGTALGRTVVGSAVIIRNGWASQTVVKVSVGGLMPSTAHMAHVHALPCAMTEGGAHYKQNAAVTEVTASAANEIWLNLTSGATGYAQGRTVLNSQVARTTDAVSIVIHDPTTPTTRLACVDLTVASGFVPTQLGLERGRNISGTARLDRLASGETKVTITAAGLLPNTVYVPHVHDRPCHVGGGGGHYKLDPSNAATVESNEMWLRMTSDATGSGSATMTVKHVARPEAQAIVIHDPVDGSRLACADLY